MITFLQNLSKTVEDVPQRAAVVDRDGLRITTYEELFTYAKKVNAWLRNNDIGREDVCAIYFSRGVEYIAVRIGIMMAGAASVGLEDLMGKDRIDYVIKDSRCRVVFDQEKWDEAMALMPCETIADPDDHDLAYIIYTSGSTGTPKGVAQEYGIYDNIMKGTFNFLGNYLLPEPMHFAEVSPQTFVSGVYTTVGVLDVRATIYEISTEMLKDMSALSRYFVEKEIHHTFMTPTFVKLLLQIPNINLRAVSIGGEIASGVYTDRFDIINVYGPSEFGYPTCTFKLDRDYDNTPIGFPTLSRDIILLDEDGKKADEGVLCIHLPYFRGYLGDERGDFIIVDDKKYFRTSDYVRREDGKYIMLDRLDDMVKINGNRVDTKEVESAIKRTLEVESCIVKLYLNNGIKLLCAYYTGDDEIESISAAKILRDYIPEYMIPSSYIKLNEIPLNANGKVDKNALPVPAGINRINPYAPPEDEIQKKLCLVLKNVLDLDEDVSIDDDFFMLGGDSIMAMAALSECDIPGLTVQMVYEGRSIRKITSLLKKAKEAMADTAAGLEDVPLNMGQLNLLKSDLKHPGSVMLNLPVRFNIIKGADFKKISLAMKATIDSHPALRSVIIKRDDTYYLHYDPDILIDCDIKQMTDEELEEAAADFVKPFTLDGKPLFRCLLIEGETKAAIFMDVYHVICDGASYVRFIDEIGESYNGKKSGDDHCFQLLFEEANDRYGERFLKDMEYFKKTYDRPGFATYPLIDHDTDENLDGEIFIDFDFKKDDVERITAKYGIGKGGLYMAAAALSIAAYNDCEDVMFTWTWHGRFDKRRMDSVGYFSKDLPISFELKGGLMLAKIYEDMAERIREGILHGNVSYWEEMGSYEGKDLVCLLYQGDIYEYHDGEDVVNMVESMEHPYEACNNILDIEILDGLDAFGVDFDYNAKKYDEKSMEKFGRIFCDILKLLLAANPNSTTVGDILGRL